jgi:hypothetical protein
MGGQQAASCSDQSSTWRPDDRTWVLNRGPIQQLLNSWPKLLGDFGVVHTQLDAAELIGEDFAHDFGELGWGGRLVCARENQLCFLVVFVRRRPEGGDANRIRSKEDLRDPLHRYSIASGQLPPFVMVRTLHGLIVAMATMRSR